MAHRDSSWGPDRWWCAEQPAVCVEHRRERQGLTPTQRQLPVHIHPARRGLLEIQQGGQQFVGVQRRRGEQRRAHQQQREQG
jgi:hypothetical protein